MTPVLFLTWIEHRRTRQLATRLKLPLIELVSRYRGVRRYLGLTLRTVDTLLEHRPRILLVQNPSLVLTFLALLLRPFLRYRLIVDAHNEAVEPYLHRSPTLLRITNLLLRKADLTVVTNRQLAAQVIARGGRAVVLPDGIPTPPAIVPKTLRSAFNIVLIATFAGDEPVDIAIEAARRIGPAIQLYITGNPGRLPTALKHSLPENVVLTGFLAEADYWGLLTSCDAVMDLTTMDNCLVCGAYEAIALGRPLLLSRNDASTELFADFAIFTENETEALIAAMTQLRERHAQIVAALPAARDVFERNWERQAAELRLALAQTS